MFPEKGTGYETSDISSADSALSGLLRQAACAGFGSGDQAKWA